MLGLVVFPVVSPKPLTFRDTFGDPRSGGRAHNGIDIYGEEGLPVIAAHQGYATSHESKAGGIGVAVAAREGTTLYEHLQARTGAFPRLVAAGEQIGELGRTGIKQDKAHLHFELRDASGAAVNPAAALRTAQVLLPSGETAPIAMAPKAPPLRVPVVEATKPKAAPLLLGAGLVGAFLIWRATK